MNLKKRVAPLESLILLMNEQRKYLIEGRRPISGDGREKMYKGIYGKFLKAIGSEIF